MDKLNKLIEAPKKGQLFLATRYKIYYQPFYGEEELEKLLEDCKEEDLLELHIFDHEKEYRCIRKKNGFLECVVSDENQNLFDDKYEETVYTIKATNDDCGQQCRVKVVNYIKYQDRGMIKFVNYRLSTVEGGGSNV